jgi:hypothetical protein
MMRKNLWWLTVRILFAVLALAAGIDAFAGPRPTHFSGVINDYSPANVMPAGPWEIRGTWSLKLKESGKADFRAALTMELPDTSDTNVTSTLMQHTHHLSIEDGTVTWLSSGGFEVTGPVTVTKNGGPVPFGASTLTVTITGGTEVEFSNVTLTFGGGAPVHFGSQAINGVVRRARAE